MLRGAKTGPAGAGASIWVTGVRRGQSQARAQTPLAKWDDERGRLKVNPLADHDLHDVHAMPGPVTGLSILSMHEAFHRLAASRVRVPSSPASQSVPAAGGGNRISRANAVCM